MEKMRPRNIPKAMLDPRYDVHIYDVNYVSHWHDGSEVLASGLYFVPQGVESPMPRSPSRNCRAEGHAAAGDGRGQSVSGLCRGGCLVLMLDHIGLGHGEKFHIYQDCRPLATTAVDILRAVRQLDTTLRVQTTDQLFLTGYSEGGYAALGTNKLIQEQYADRFRVTATSANAGVYDKPGHVAAIRPYGRPQFLPFLLMGVNEVYGIAPDVHDLYMPPYDSLVRVFFDGSHGGEVMTAHFLSIAEHMLQGWVVEDYHNNPSSLFRKALTDNTITYWRPDNPVQFFHCMGDETVFCEKSVVALNAMRQLGAPDVTLRNPGQKYGHRSCGLLATAYSKFYFDSLLPHAKHGREGSSTQLFLMGMLKLKRPVTK